MNLLKKIVLGVVLATGVGGGMLTVTAPQAAAVSPPAPNRPPDWEGGGYSYADAEYDGETELSMGNYYAYRIVQQDASHFMLQLWAKR